MSREKKLFTAKTKRDFVKKKYHCDISVQSLQCQMKIKSLSKDDDSWKKISTKILKQKKNV